MSSDNQLETIGLLIYIIILSTERLLIAAGL